MHNCIICSKKTKKISFPVNKCVVPMGFKLIKFDLMKCTRCNHLQKKLSKSWHTGLKNLYQKKYKFIGKHISVDKSQNKIVDRNQQVSFFIKQKLKLNSVGKILDVGCGTGAFLKSFKKANPNWGLYAHDLSKLNKKVVEKKIKLEKFFIGEVSIISGKYDLITLNHVAEHLIEPVKVLKLLSNNLKEDGFLIIRSPNVKNVHTDLTILDHCSHFTPESLKNLVNISGLKIFKFFNKLNPIEIFAVAKKIKNLKNLKKIKKSPLKIQDLKNLSWPNDIIRAIINSKSKNIGVFGLGTATFYLQAALKKKINFFVDEDQSKVGKQYYGKKIFSIKKIPNNSEIFIPVHNKKFANLIRKRISKINKSVRFIVP